MRIPLLRDRHSHPLLYAALLDSVDLNRPAETRESALARIRERALGGHSDWTIATGWNSGRFPLSKPDFDDLCDKLRYQWENRERLAVEAFDLTKKVQKDYDWLTLTEKAFAHLN